MSPDLARQLAGVSAAIGRQVGLLVARRGTVDAVFVGEPERIYLPQLGRSGGGPRHFRGQRHIHSVLGAAALTQDDLTDLTRLGLDAVVALGVSPQGGAVDLAYAYALPPTAAGVRPVQQEYVDEVGALELDFAALLVALAQEGRGQPRRAQATAAGPRAILLGVYPDRPTATWRMAELRELCATAGVQVEDGLVQLRKRPDARFVVGQGKLEEAVLRCLDLDAELLVVDQSLTPTQARAMAAFSELKILDRTQLILDIFAQHAQSRDGKLQVELAQLRYTLPRLTDMDAGLSRLSGGIGGRGPGETKLEINRRRARDRMVRLEHEVAGLARARALRRQRRQHSGLPVICLVGYTNAGKSTLLNRLTQSGVLVADQLFATLDPTSRQVRLGPEQPAIINDTVGFIHDLPADLMKAFHATLEELEGADLLLHVVDVGDPRCEAKMAAVASILADLHLTTIPCLVVFNKADTVEPFIAHAHAQRHAGVSVSAQNGEGIASLLQTLAERLRQPVAGVAASDNPVEDGETPLKVPV